MLDPEETMTMSLALVPCQDLFALDFSPHFGSRSIANNILAAISYD